MIQLIFDSSLCADEITLDGNQSYTRNDFNQIINAYSHEHFGTTFDFYLVHSGKAYNEGKCSSGTIRIVPRLRGGKGGFGSMLRAIGAQIEKTTNREACRDLSGRRLRDINEEKRLKKWIAEQAEREQEAARKKKQKLEKLSEIVKHKFTDDDYTKARLEMPDKIYESLEEGLKAVASVASTSTTQEDKNEEESKEEKNDASDKPPETSQQKKPEKGKKKKKRKRPMEKKKIKGNLWVDEALGSLSETSEEETPKKKIKTS